MVEDESFSVVIDAELGLFVHGIRIKESCSCKTWEVLTVGVTSEDEAGRDKALRLIWVGIYFGLLGVFVVAEAECLSWHVSNKCFTKTNAGFNINLLIIVVGWVSCVNDICILGWNDPLAQHCHEHLVQSNSNLLNSQECSFVELTCPYFLNGEPSLIKLLRRNTKHLKLILDVFMVLVILLE